MGTFTVGCKVANHEDRSRSKVIPRLLVDTGSEYTWIAASTLRELGIEPEKKIYAQMANGAVLEREAGFAYIMVGKFFTIAPVVFALKGDPLLLGAQTLEGMNVRVDPNSEQLVDAGPTPAAPMADYTEEEARIYRESFGSRGTAPLAVPRADIALAPANLRVPMRKRRRKG